LGKVPGVEAAATTGDDLPGVPQHYPTELKFVEGEQDPEHKMVAESRFVSPSFVGTMQIPLIAGELCRDPLLVPRSTPEDLTGMRHVDVTRIEVLVNRSFAATYAAGSTAVGRHLSVQGLAFLKPDQAGEIRGIVGDAREEGMNHEPSPTVYWCMSASGPDPFYIVRTHSAQPLTMAGTLRQKIQEIEPGRSVFDITPLEDRIDKAFAENRLRTILLTFFAVTAVSLACIGLYGTLSYSVNVRQREVGLRLALGALRGQIAKQFLLQGLSVAVIGCAAGWALALASSRILSEMLYGVSPSDVVTLSSVILLVIIVAAVASLVPAVRAARLDPMQVLREE
jgi:putative ABC transport system permease protein